MRVKLQRWTFCPYNSRDHLKSVAEGWGQTNRQDAPFLLTGKGLTNKRQDETRWPKRHRRVCQKTISRPLLRQAEPFAFCTLHCQHHVLQAACRAHDHLHAHDHLLPQLPRLFVRFVPSPTGHQQSISPGKKISLLMSFLCTLWNWLIIILVVK